MRAACLPTHMKKIPWLFVFLLFIPTIAAAQDKLLTLG
jgi:hypothetical protein